MSRQKEHDFYEICVADVHGTIILNTTIDYGYSVQVMFDSINDAGHQGILKKVYGAPSGQHPQNAMIMAQVADRLSNISVQNACG